MKALKTAFIILGVLLLVLFIALLIFIKTFDVNRFKPQIKNEAGKALNRKLDFDKAQLGISLQRGIGVNIEGLSISEDPLFADGDFLTMKGISVGVDALGYLLRKEVRIPGIFIDSAKVNVIRNPDGGINVATLGKPASPSQAASSAPASAALALPAILVNSLKASDAELVYMDRSFDPPLRLDISGINIGVNKISLTAPFPFFAEAAVLSPKKNVRIEGEARVYLDKSEVSISGFKGITELSDISLSMLSSSFPMIGKDLLPDSMKGRVELSVPVLRAGSSGLTEFKSEVFLKDALFRFGKPLVPLAVKQAVLSVGLDKVILEKAEVELAEGQINASGVLDDYAGKQVFSCDAILQDIKIEDLLLETDSPLKAEGIVSGRFKIKGQGFAPVDLAQRLSGRADISVIQAKLKDINILRTVLDKISVIPGLSQRMEEGLPDKYKQALAQKDTILTDIKLPMLIENGSIILNETTFGAQEFLFRGSGSVGFDGAFSVEGSFLIPEDLSASMVKGASGLEYLLNEDKQIYIPLKVSGSAGSMDFIVDTDYIARKILTDRVEEKIFKALDKAFGKDATTSTGDNANQTQQQGAGIEEAVGSVLRGIFNK